MNRTGYSQAYRYDSPRERVRLFNLFASPEYVDDAGRPMKFSRRAWSNRRHYSETAATKRAALILHHLIWMQNLRSAPRAALLMVFGLMAAVVLMYVFGIKNAVLMSTLVLFVILMLVVVPSHTRQGLNAPPGVARDILAQGVCPQCASALTEIGDSSLTSLRLVMKPVPGRSDLAACPVCEAAWRIDRIRIGSRAMAQPAQSNQPGGPMQRFASWFVSQEALNPLLDDATGVRVPVYDPRFGELIRNDPPSITERRRAAINRAEFIGTPKPWTSLERIYLILLLFYGPFVFYNAISANDASIFRTVVFPASQVLILIYIGYMLVQSRRGALYTSEQGGHAQCLLSADLCPSCGADIETAARNDHGYRTCPQCAAVWGNSISKTHLA